MRVLLIKESKFLIFMVKGKGKGKFVPVYAIKAYGGCRNIAPRILNFGARSS